MSSSRPASALSNDLRIAVMRLARRLRAERADDALTFNQLSVLSTLENHGAMTIGDLAAHEKVQPPSMTRTVACLEESGHLARGPHPTDRRQVMVELTAAGHDRVLADRRRRDAWLDRQLRELTREERETLRAVAPLLGRLAGS